VAGLVRLRPAADLEARYPEFTATRVTITTDDGRSLTRLVEVPAGDSRAPLTTDQLVAKFGGYVGAAFDTATADRVATALLAQPTGLPVRVLTGLLAGTRA
jgi:2-methylcitrate dehydratase PrpD